MLRAREKPQAALPVGAPASHAEFAQTLAAEPPHYHEHRMRLRTRFLEAGAQALADYELSSEETGALRELAVDAGNTDSAPLDRRETKKVLPFWLTGGL